MNCIHSKTWKLFLKGEKINIMILITIEKREDFILNNNKNVIRNHFDVAQRTLLMRCYHHPPRDQMHLPISLIFPFPSSLSFPETLQLEDY